MAGVYSAQGCGVLRSTDYGETWKHVGNGKAEAIVFGSAKHVYAIVGGAAGLGTMLDTDYETADLPATGTWTEPAIPSGMHQGPAQAAMTNDGTHNIFFIANYNAGVWRYIEP